MFFLYIDICSWVICVRNQEHIWKQEFYRKEKKTWEKASIHGCICRRERYEAEWDSSWMPTPTHLSGQLIVCKKAAPFPLPLTKSAPQNSPFLQTKKKKTQPRWIFDLWLSSAQKPRCVMAVPPVCVSMEENKNLPYLYTEYSPIPPRPAEWQCSSWPYMI